MLEFLLSITDESQRENITWLYNKFHVQMLKFARALMYNNRWVNYHCDALDVVQEAYRKLIEKGSVDFTRSEKEIKCFLATSVYNTAMDYMKGYKFEDGLDEAENSFCFYEDDGFFDNITVGDRYKAVVGAIDKMNMRYKTVMAWAAKGKNPQQIARILNLPTKTVYTRLKRAKEQLLYILKHDYGIEYKFAKKSTASGRIAQNAKKSLQY